MGFRTSSEYVKLILLYSGFILLYISIQRNY